MQNYLKSYKNVLFIFIKSIVFFLVVFFSILYGAAIGYQGILDFFPSWNKVDQIAKFFPGIYIRETPFGLVPSNSSQGIKYKDLTFIKEFRGRISDLDVPEELQFNLNLDPTEITTSIKNKMTHEFKNKLSLLKTKIEDEDSFTIWLSFLTLRVNGSFSAYSVRFMHNDYWSRLFSNTGNCSDHATRLANILDLFNEVPYWYTIHTNSIPGHIVVSVFNKKNNTSYILDPTNNVIVKFRNSHGLWFNKWISLSTKDKEFEISNNVKIIKFPNYFRIVNPGISSLDSININEVTLNRSLKNIEEKYIKFLTTEFDEQIEFWKKIHAPHFPSLANKLKPIDLLNGKEIKWNHKLQEKQTIEEIGKLRI